MKPMNSSSTTLLIYLCLCKKQTNFLCSFTSLSSLTSPFSLPKLGFSGSNHMMSPDNNKTPSKDENPSSTARKTASARPQGQEPAQKCPRCDSPNTKFCYYNNYSLTQPRHFCKTCRRYWTKGGALRNVPIGGGCRKNKKMKSNSPRLSGDSKDHSIGSSSEIGGLKFFQGLAPAMDFQLGGINIPRVQSPNTGLMNQFSSFGQEIGYGFNPPIGFQEMGSASLNVHSNIASSIESLSSINQDLHWKLQQQRLAMLFFGDNQQKDQSALPSAPVEIPFVQKPQPILFQNLEINSSKQIDQVSRKEGQNGNLSTEWFFDNASYNTTVNPTPATSGSGLNENTSSWPGGVQAWSDLTQYNALP